MLRLTIIISLLASFVLVRAQSEAIELTGSDITRFINSYPDIKEEFEDLGVKYENVNDGFTLPEGVNIMADINRIVEKHGYSDYTDYFTKAGTILTTYAAIKLNEESENLQPELQQAIKEIENNPYYTAEQKEELINAIKESSAALDQAGEEMAGSKNIEVVKTHFGALEAVLEED